MPLILIVDDDAGIRKLLEALFTGAGFLVHLAENGARALELVRESPPDVILMDIHMSIMDGIEAARTLKEDTATRQIPIVAMSARIHLIDHCAQPHFASIVAKPFDPSCLMAEVKRWMRDQDSECSVS